MSPNASPSPYRDNREVARRQTPSLPSPVQTAQFTVPGSASLRPEGGEADACPLSRPAAHKGKESAHGSVCVLGEGSDGEEKPKEKGYCDHEGYDDDDNEAVFGWDGEKIW